MISKLSNANRSGNLDLSLLVDSLTLVRFLKVLCGGKLLFLRSLYLFPRKFFKQFLSYMNFSFYLN